MTAESEESSVLRLCTCGKTRQYMPEDVMAAGGEMTHYYNGRDCREGNEIADHLKAVLSPEEWAKIKDRYV